MAEESSNSSSSNQFTITIKGPSDVKLSITIASGATVEQLKQAIADKNSDFPKDNQRLIFSGRVLKDEQVLASYGVKNGVAIHLVKGARPAGSSSNTPASRGPSEAAGVPSNFGAGQQIMGNPLAPLMNAQYAGQLGGFNPFAEMGINPNDPNYVQQMMQSPEVQGQMNRLLSDPAVVDQLIDSNPQLQAMGPQVRQIMQSEHFRNFVTNPHAMRNMMDMMGGGGGGAAGGFPPPGAFGFGSGQAQTNQGAGAGAGGASNLFNPWGSATPASPSAANPDSTTGSAPTNPNAATGQGAFNPFARGTEGQQGGAGGMPDFNQLMQNMNQLQQLQNMFGGAGGMGGMGGMGGFGGAGNTSGAPQVPPEERFATQLEQMQAMGFTDASRNVRALLAAGGNVEAAISYLFDNPQ
ncbi:hypothetical protein JCM3765_006503 [Sporobolomyces pararoseus]